MLPNTYLTFSLPLLVLSLGCNQHESSAHNSAIQQPKTTANGFRLPRVWIHTDSEPPEMKLLLSENGVCTFEGGFLYWNPGRWTFDISTSKLTLTFPKMSTRQFAEMLKESERDQIVSSNPTLKSISYTIQSIDPQFTFQGRGFIPDSSSNH